MNSHCLLGYWIRKIPRVSNTLNPIFFVDTLIPPGLLALPKWNKTESQKQADGKKNTRCQRCQVFQFRGVPKSKSIILQVIPCIKKSDLMPMLQDVQLQSCHFKNKLCSLSDLENSTVKELRTRNCHSTMLLPCQPPPLHLQQHPSSASERVRVRDGY